MKLKKLVVRDLFGHFNHVVPFNEEHATIITAPNGYGKTVVLKIIDAIFNRRFGFLSRLDFSSISLVTSNGTLEISKSSEEPVSESITVSLDGIASDVYTYRHEKITKNLRRFPSHMIDTRLPFLTRVGEREWLDERTGEFVDFEYIVENFPEMLPEKVQFDDVPPWLLSFTGLLTSHFIQDQRLILRSVDLRRAKRGGFIDTIEKYAHELSERIRESSSDSSKISQQLDTTFPVRLLKADTSFKAHDKDQIKSELSLLQNKREILAKYNLLPSDQHLPDVYVFNEITDADTKVLTLYVEDTKKKLEAYDSLLSKIELFSSILNKKRLSFKKISIDPEKGFIFETDKGRPLKLTQLSSGEQHQVVLLYELIFKTQEDVLVLIDEPEISLHVAWQKDFLDDLKKIIDIQNMVVVVATHSPQIIDNNWNLVVDLEEGAYA